MVRFLIATITGLIAGSLLIFIGNMVFMSLYPTDAISSTTEGLDFNYISNAGYCTRLVAHGLGAFIAGLVAALVAIKTKYSSGVTSFLVIFIGIIYFVFANAYPTWFVVSDITVTAILGFLGVIVGASRRL
jgi:hypothetical protein